MGSISEGRGGGSSFYLSAAILHHQSSSPLSVPRLKDTSGSLVSSEEDSHLSMCLFFFFSTKVESERGFVWVRRREREKKKIERGSNLFFRMSISLGTNLAPFGLPVQVSSLGSDGLLSLWSSSPLQHINTLNFSCRVPELSCMTRSSFIYSV